MALGHYANNCFNSVAYIAGAEIMIKAETIVVLPVHNEEDAILPVIKDVLNSCPCHVVVSFSGCSDSTHAYVAHNHLLHGKNERVHLLRSPKGKGLAIKKAFANIEAKSVIMLDSDGTYPADQIPHFVDQLRFYDAVIGVRKLADNINISSVNRWGNQVINSQANMLYNSQMDDICTGMWGFNGHVLKDLNIKSHGFTLEVELFVYLVKHHYRIGQIPIDYRRRIGDSKLRRSDGLKILWYLWSRRIF